MVAEPPAEKLLMPPVLFLRDNIENYVREALHFLPIRIYKVEAWFDEKGITTNQIGESFVRLPDIVIPLVGSLEIGLIAEKMYFIQKMSPGDEDKEDYSEPKLLGILKDFRFTSHDLKIDYVKVDLSGRTYDSAQYSSDLILPCSRVTLANLPMKNAQHRDYPNPRDASLEMIVRVAESKKQKSGKLMSSQDPSHHVSSVHVSAPRPEGKFRIMVDGVLFGPFYTISVSPIEVDGRHMSLPVSTFFPIQGM